MNKNELKELLEDNLINIIENNDVDRDFVEVFLEDFDEDAFVYVTIVNDTIEIYEENREDIQDRIFI